ncbi:EamA family transporter [Streptomyces somaliensis DSM 40738]|uniref:EamA family transporter n=1 Tax=Streptomyces somaliensis (strain ATCC 33201 / DSM 40738 / JCM 12659 / KCTC 9044 / NCTC 11332 / NRRL B-12077 / IP 733) TaxID=1134445 RepID=A0AA44DCM4_STRE0|nr:EamA family transporter [Streptomyces somaliensis]MCQ0023460.1 EamA family transporter [Streptomyces somaliensis DSM 40738]NKY14282.1 EamA family transporter [Streptomyces somaliensis DSM 40738]
MTTARISGAVWAALAIVYLVWGSTYLGIRVVVETLPPFLSAGARFVVAGLLLAALLAWRHGPGALKITRAQLASAAFVGLMLLVGGNGLVVLAETSVPSGLAALLVAVMPAWVVLLRSVSGDRPGPSAYAGVALGLAGLAVLSLPGLSGDVHIGGVLTVVLATLMWSAGSFSSSRIPMPRNPFTASAYEMLAGGLGCALVGLVRGEQRGLDLADVSTRSWTALAYLVVFGSLIAFTAYAWLLQNAPLSLTATYAYVNPVVAVVLGWLILDEALTWSIALGGAVVVAGVWLIVRTERRPVPAEPAEPEPLPLHDGQPPSRSAGPTV